MRPIWLHRARQSASEGTVGHIRSRGEFHEALRSSQEATTTHQVNYHEDPKAFRECKGGCRWSPEALVRSPGRLPRSHPASCHQAIRRLPRAVLGRGCAGPELTTGWPDATTGLSSRLPRSHSAACHEAIRPLTIQVCRRMIIFAEPLIAIQLWHSTNEY